jgi:hypothetical protein
MLALPGQDSPRLNGVGLAVNVDGRQDIIFLIY